MGTGVGYIVWDYCITVLMWWSGLANLASTAANFRLSWFGWLETIARAMVGLGLCALGLRFTIVLATAGDILLPWPSSLALTSFGIGATILAGLRFLTNWEAGAGGPTLTEFVEHRAHNKSAS